MKYIPPSHAEPPQRPLNAAAMAAALTLCITATLKFDAWSTLVGCATAAAIAAALAATGFVHDDDPP